MARDIYFYTNRTLCAVLEEMRSCFKTHNFSAMPGLIEEIQVLGNRMESALEDQKTVRQVKEALPKLKKEYKKLTKEIRDLEAKKGIKKKSSSRP